MKKIKPLLKETYLSLIRNSVGTNMFRNFYVLTEKGKEDLLNDGEFSCAYYVSSILKILDLIEKAHVTVDSTERDLIKSGWTRLSAENIKDGSVIIWKAIIIGKTYNRHIGFYVGNNNAVSASYKLRRVASHNITFNGKREIEAVYWRN